MHIVVFYQYYHNPDCPAAARHYTFVREWSQKHRVTIISGKSWHERRISREFDWVPAGVDIKLLDVDYDNAMSTSERMKSFGHFAFKALGMGLSVDRPTVIFGTSTPLSAVWAAAKVAKLKRVPWIFEVRDLWPDFPIQMGAITNPIVKRWLKKTEEGLYRSAAHVIALSPDMADHVKGCGINDARVTTLMNGTDFDLLDSISEQSLAMLREEHGLAGKRVVLYAGTFGRANDVPTLLETAERLADRSDIRFVFLGTGLFRDQVHAAADDHDNILTLDPLPRHEVLKWFKLADLSLATFIDRPVLAANSPSKLFDSLGAGTPVVVTNPGWSRKFVEEHECGWYVPPSSPSSLARTIVDALDSPWDLARAGVNARRTASEGFDRVEMAAKIEAIMMSAAGSKVPA
jgi:glycosyltransferase involved in cell wall biosynthesis